MTKSSLSLILFTLAVPIVAQPTTVSGLKSNGNLGGTGTFRTDCQVEVLNPSSGHAFIAVGQTQTPGQTLGEEAGIAYYGYDGDGVAMQLSSITSRMSEVNAVANDATSVLRISTLWEDDSVVHQDHDIDIWGGKGVYVFPPGDGDGPDSIAHAPGLHKMTVGGAFRVLASNGQDVGGSFTAIMDGRDSAGNHGVVTGYDSTHGVIAPVAGDGLQLRVYNGSAWVSPIEVTSAGYFAIKTTTAPSTPPSGTVYLFVDSGHLKAKLPDGSTNDLIH
jgi:hypothetical protein